MIGHQNIWCFAKIQGCQVVRIQGSQYQAIKPYMYIIPDYFGTCKDDRSSEYMVVEKEYRVVKLSAHRALNVGLYIHICTAYLTI